jgi:hypothetical protein
MSISNSLKKPQELTWSAEDAEIISKGIIEAAQSKEKQKSPNLQKDLCLDRIKGILREEEDTHHPLSSPCAKKIPAPILRSFKPRSQRAHLRRNGPVVKELNALFDANSFTGKILQRRGPRALLRYLNRPQKYIVAKVSAIWIFPSSVNLHGQLGYHACILLPGNRLSELEKVKDRSFEELAPRLAEKEVRYATGKQIEKMWLLDRELIPQYQKWGEPGTREGWRNYRFITNDCFTYINRILQETGQPPTNLHRTDPYTLASCIATLITPSVPALSHDSSRTDSSRAIQLQPSRTD